MGVPFMRAASKTLVPAGTWTGRPSMVISINPDGVVVVLTIPLLRAPLDECLRAALRRHAPQP
jgi:hypothetical protein